MKSFVPPTVISASDNTPFVAIDHSIKTVSISGKVFESDKEEDRSKIEVLLDPLTYHQIEEVTFQIDKADNFGIELLRNILELLKQVNTDITIKWFSHEYDFQGIEIGKRLAEQTSQPILGLIIVEAGYFTAA